MEELYRTLGYAKSVELSKKSRTFWDMLQLSESRKNAVVGGTVREGIAKDFIRELLPPRLRLKSGLVYDAAGKILSPQCDAIIYSGVPLLEYTDIVVAEKKQVKAIIEIKAWIDQGTLFGSKIQGTQSRNPNTGLFSAYISRRGFLSEGAKYILFAFQLHSAQPDEYVAVRLREVCDDFAIILRREPVTEQHSGKDPWVYNFDNSVSRLIEWLRILD